MKYLKIKEEFFLSFVMNTDHHIYGKKLKINGFLRHTANKDGVDD